MELPSASSPATTTYPQSTSHPNSPPHTHYTEPTTYYWQEIIPSSDATPAPWQYSYPAILPDNRILRLPIRPLKDSPTDAVASLLLNQASMEVVEVLGMLLADALRPYSPEIIIGLPTLGLSIAPIVAKSLGHSRYTPLGYSRKFWYLPSLSTPVSSLTSPTPGLKTLYLDPNQLPLLHGKRIALVDDTVSSGTTLLATWDLLDRIGCTPVVVGVVMRQGVRWTSVLGEERAGRVVGVFESPLLREVQGGWVVKD